MRRRWNAAYALLSLAAVELGDRIIVVTGGGSGIGRAMVERFAKDNPGGIAVVDRDGEAARMAADKVDGLAITADLGRESEVLRVIAQTEAQYGQIDLFVPTPALGDPAAVSRFRTTAGRRTGTSTSWLTCGPRVRSPQ
jgi:NAD(P)-dependent dehydrogenase (short-subunit alcohol dehydrogenase family)